MRLAAFFYEPRASATENSAARCTIDPIQGNGNRTPVFAVGTDDLRSRYGLLVRHLGEDQPFFGVQAPADAFERVAHLGGSLAGEIAAFRPEGPCIIAGHGKGGAVAFELGRRLFERGRNIPFVALFATPFPSRWKLFNRYTPGRFPGPLCLFLPSPSWNSIPGTRRWSSVAKHAEEYCAPYGCDAEHMLCDPYVRHVARLFVSCRDIHPGSKPPARSPSSGIRAGLQESSAGR